tara:strand:+ start:1299 stop:1454 length:156 start_codon:yes stop_codon:yes gene_type:complete
MPVERICIFEDRLVGTLDVHEVVHDPPVVDVGHLSQPDESFIGVELYEDVT